MKMKKVILAAALVCAATFVNGAAVEWSMTAVAKSSSTDLAAGAMIGYFMDGSTWETFSGLSSDKIAAFVTANAVDSGTLAVARNQGTISGKFGDYAVGEKVSGYLVVFDNSTASEADFYANTVMTTATVPSAGNLKFAKAFATTTSGWQEIKATPGPGPDPVPEPTSGLLLVLGGAVLALRRRR